MHLPFSQAVRAKPGAGTGSLLSAVLPAGLAAPPLEDMFVHVLTTTYWPSYPIVAAPLPAVVCLRPTRHSRSVPLLPSSARLFASFVHCDL